MTSPLRVFTTILLPTASSTSIDSVFLRRKEWEGKEEEKGRRRKRERNSRWKRESGSREMRYT